MNKEEIYKLLKEKLTDKEIAESYMIPEELSQEELQIAAEELKRLRFELLGKKTEQENILSEVMRLRILIKNYIKNQPFSEKQTFGSYLSEYIRIIRIPKKDFAKDIGIHYTRLSRIVNDKEEPNIELTYRLEKHSDYLIPAVLWWKLMVKKQEYLINKDEKTRNIEAKKVKNMLKQSA